RHLCGVGSPREQATAHTNSRPTRSSIEAKAQRLGRAVGIRSTDGEAQRLAKRDRLVSNRSQGWRRIISASAQCVGCPWSRRIKREPSRRPIRIAAFADVVQLVAECNRVDQCQAVGLIEYDRIARAA